jgi:ring-1,2-phenylacetyl-CoA epoxidase subunit PaaC
VNQSSVSSLQSPVEPAKNILRRVLGHADDNLILAQRLGEWSSRAPDLETDIALSNIALDHLGVARALLSYGAEIEGQGRTEDDLAMLRTERGFTNLLICEQPNGDFAQTIVRQFLFDAYQLSLWLALQRDPDPTLSGVAAKAIKEAQYHFRFSSTWLIRLGGGTDESHRRAASAMTALWRFSGEMLEQQETASLGAEWDRRVNGVLLHASLERPSDTFQLRGGRQGSHTEHLGHLLTEMQWMARAYPGASW